MQILVLFIVPCSAHKLSSLFFILFFSYPDCIISSVLLLPSHWLFLLHGQVYFWNSSLNFSVKLLYFSTLGFLFVLLFWWWLLFHCQTSHLFMYYFPNFICLSLFSCRSLNFPKRIILNSLCNSLWISISLGSVLGALVVSFGSYLPDFS